MILELFYHVQFKAIFQLFYKIKIYFIYNSFIKNSPVCIITF